jgi:D-threo-aldose 1-dehydrogenase
MGQVRRRALPCYGWAGWMEMDPLKKVRLGKTSLEVTRLGMGGAPLGGLYKDLPDEVAEAAVERALALGIRFFDTAPLYGHGKSEIRMGRVLARENRDSFVLSTKVGRLFTPADSGKVESPWFENPSPLTPHFDFSYDGVMRSYEESRKRLKLGRIDILYIHDPDDHFEQALEGAYRALDELRRSGAVRAIGAGMNQAEMLARFAREADFDCFLLAGRYTLIDHTGLKELLPLCVKKEISIVLGGPYNSGILATGAVPGAKFNYQDAPPALLEKVSRLEQICGRYKTPLKAAALQFPLAHPAVAAIIPGARSAAEVDENFELVQFPIPRDFWVELREQKLLPDGAPVPGD